MRLISGPRLAVAVTNARGLGFIGAGYEFTQLDAYLAESAQQLQSSPVAADVPSGVLPIGVGVIMHAADLVQFLKVLAIHPPVAALWLFAPKDPLQLEQWTTALRTSDVLPESHRLKTDVWLQVGRVSDAVAGAKLRHAPDILVVQGVDAGGHGLEKGAGLISLLPEVKAAMDGLLLNGEISKTPHLVGTGGLATSSSIAAVMCLGASGVCLGTRYLCTPEANVSDGYRQALIEASDGGQNTQRTRVYDTLRGTEWPVGYGGRGVLNASFRDHEKGMSVEENTRLYNEAVEKGDQGWGEQAGRITTYGGTGVGLIKDIKSASEITAELIEDCRKHISAFSLCVS